MIAFLIALGFGGMPVDAARAASPRHSVSRCAVGDALLELEELRVPRGGKWRLEAVRNPSARHNSRCRSGYGGDDLEKLALDGRLPADTFGATNGTFFRMTKKGYAANGLLWNEDEELAPWRAAGGKHLFVMDPQGGHLEPATGPDALARARKRHPKMTFALQSGMDLLKRPEFECDAGNRASWKCNSVARTALCARRDGTVSLFFSSPATPAEVGAALRPGGRCHADCVVLLNLDGGGSSQLGYFDGHAWKMSGYRLETTEPGCSAYRPVDHYFVVRKR